MDQPGIMGQIRGLLSEGKSSREVIDMGFAPGSVYKVQRQLRGRAEGITVLNESAEPRKQPDPGGPQSALQLMGGDLVLHGPGQLGGDANLVLQVLRHERTIEKLEAQVEQSRAEVEGLREQVDAVETELGEAHVEAGAGRRDRDVWRGEAQQADAECNALKAKVAFLERQLAGAFLVCPKCKEPKSEHQRSSCTPGDWTCPEPCIRIVDDRSPLTCWAAGPSARLLSPGYIESLIAKCR